MAKERNWRRRFFKEIIKTQDSRYIEYWNTVLKQITRQLGLRDSRNICETAVNFEYYFTKTGRTDYKEYLDSDKPWF